jgi:hypothetical protein
MDSAKERLPSGTSRRKAKQLLGYTERHHIIPKSMGGDNSDDNLVWLTAQEHLDAHILLTNMMGDRESERKMLASAVRMLNPQSRSQQRIFVSTYDDIRKAAAVAHGELMRERQKGSKNSFFNKKHSTESKQKISEGGRGMKRSPETKKNLSNSKMGDKNPARKIMTCPHCNLEGRSGGMLRWHFENCKQKKG